MARFTYGNMNYSEGEPIMNNLTEKEKHVNTYSHFIAIRILSIFVCILLAAAYSPGNVNNFFVSYYDTFMIREIFELESINGFWSEMNLYLLSTYIVSIIALIVNAFLVSRDRREGAISDIAIYLMLTLACPFYVSFSMIGSKSSSFKENARYDILIAPVIFFLVMLICHIRLYNKNKEMFHDKKTAAQESSGLVFLCLVSVLGVVIIPMIFTAKAMKLVMDYRVNYGTYIASPGEIDGINEDDKGNRIHQSFIWKNQLYLTDNGKIYTINGDGRVDELYDMGVKKTFTAFYQDETNGYLFIGSIDDPENFNIYRVDLSSGEKSLIYTEPYVADVRGAYLFAVKGDYIYFELVDIESNDGSSIYRIRIPEGKDTTVQEKELFISDLKNGDRKEHEYLLLDNYNANEYVHYGTNKDILPYKGTWYFLEPHHNDSLGCYKYIGGTAINKYSNEAIVDKADSFNIYKDKIYYVYIEELESGDNASKVTLCSMNLDGTDQKVLAEQEEIYNHMYVNNIAVSDDYVVVNLKPEGWIVVDR